MKERLKKEEEFSFTLINWVGTHWIKEEKLKGKQYNLYLQSQFLTPVLNH